MPETLTEPQVVRDGDLEIHTLPTGAKAVYRDRDHSYWKDGNATTGKCSGRLTGVSTVVAPYDWRPDNLMRWAARINGEGVAALAADGLSQEDIEDMRACLQFLTSGESIWQALADGGLLYDQARDDAAQRGTNVHKFALHNMAEGRAVPDFASMTDEEHGYARGVLSFWHHCEPEPLYAEQVVLNEPLGIAGRLDLIATAERWVQQDGRPVGGVMPGARVLLDCKTSGFIPTKHHVQIAGYDACAITSGIGGSDNTLILQVDAEGGYELIPGCATHEDFGHAVEVYRRAARIGRECNAARKAAA